MSYNVYYLLDSGMIMWKDENGDALFCLATFKQFKDVAIDMLGCNDQHKFFVQSGLGSEPLPYRP